MAYDYRMNVCPIQSPTFLFISLVVRQFRTAPVRACRLAPSGVGNGHVDRDRLIIIYNTLLAEIYRTHQFAPTLFTLLVLFIANQWKHTQKLDSRQFHLNCFYLKVFLCSRGERQPSDCMRYERILLKRQYSVFYT